MTIKPRSILVHVSGDRLGDALLKFPVIRALREELPDVKLTWVTARNPSIFAGRLSSLAAGLIDEIHSETGIGNSPLAPLPGYVAGPYDVVVASESRIRDALTLRRIPSKEFISPAAGFLLSSRKPQEPFKPLSSYDRFRVLMSLAAGRMLRPRAEIDLPKRFVDAARHALPPGRRYVGLSPGAGGARKRWPVENYIELARRLSDQGFVPVFFGGPEESHLWDLVERKVPSAMTPERSLAVQFGDDPMITIALGQRLKFAVANDSGGGHLIAAAGRPLLTIFGHTNPAKFSSPYCRHVTLSAEEVGRRSIEDISVDDVFRQKEGFPPSKTRWATEP